MKNKSSWERRELVFLVSYAILFYVVVIRRSLQIAHDHRGKLYGLRAGLVADRLVDASDAQWRNFRANLPILSSVFLIFTLVANISRSCFQLKARGMAFVWLFISLAYLSYLHGTCVIFILAIASISYLLVKIFARTKYFSSVIWIFNISFLICNRVYGGYSFSSIGNKLAFLDSFRGTFRWQICFNFVILRMISFGYDYHWAHQESRFDHEKHIQRCLVCKSGKTCYHVMQETNISNDKFSFSIYLCYLLYAPLYIAGPILSFKAFASQLDMAWNKNSTRDVAWYGIRWLFSLFLMELMSHLFYYNAFAISGLWKQLSPTDVFIIGYGVLNFMWLKFFLIWRYFRLWSLINGIEAPENMPKCINNCYNFQSFWKNWHASFNKWLVRYMYIPLGGSQRKLFNVWFIFTFVAVWHDLEWKLLSWAWLTCIFFVPEMIMQSVANKFQAIVYCIFDNDLHDYLAGSRLSIKHACQNFVSALRYIFGKAESAFGQFIFRELSALAGAVTISCLMVANLVGFVVGPSGINGLISQFISKEGLPILGVIFFTFYIATKLMFQIHDAEQRRLTEARSK